MKILIFVDIGIIKIKQIHKKYIGFRCLKGHFGRKGTKVWKR